MEIDLKKLAETYLRSRHQRDEDFWACEEVNDKVRSGDLDRAYDITLLLLKTAATDDELSPNQSDPSIRTIPVDIGQLDLP